MNTVILDENQYPFEIDQHAITTHFALFQKFIDERRQLTLALTKGEVDKAIEDITNAEAGECIAKSFYSYVGEKREEDKWITDKEVAIGGEFSKFELLALKSAIRAEVIKAFKCEVSDSQVTSERKMTDIVNDPYNEPTQLAYVPISFMNPDGSANLKPEQEIVIKSIFSHPVPPQTIYPTEQPTVVM